MKQTDGTAAAAADATLAQIYIQMCAGGVLRASRLVTKRRLNDARTRMT